VQTIVNIIEPDHGVVADLAKMNLAVHGLEGDIREANTFYDDVPRLQDGRPLWGHCDFMMANPPFNVDMVYAERVKDDRRLPFGLPGVNKDKRVSNSNYLWISYFHSYLSPHRPCRFCDVVPGQQRRPWREGSAPQAGGDRGRGRDGRYPLQLFLHPHRALRVVAL
jgi:hypothetical protein